MTGEKQGGQNPSPRAYSGKAKAQMCEDVAEVALDATLVRRVLVILLAEVLQDSGDLVAAHRAHEVRPIGNFGGLPQSTVPSEASAGISARIESIAAF